MSVPDRILTKRELEALLALAEKATPGPWDSEYDGNGMEIGPARSRVAYVDDYEGYRENAAFIAASREAIPAAGHTITRLVGLVEALAKMPCDDPMDIDVAYETGRGSGQWVKEDCDECPPCRARATMDEWRKE